MKLTNRSSFETLATQARERFDALNSGERWVISVPISEDSKAKGVLATYDHLRFQIERRGMDATLRQVGSGGWAWADPSVIVVGPGHPKILYGNIDADTVPEFLDALQRGQIFRPRAIGVFGESAHGTLPSLNHDPFFGRQHRVLTANWAEIDPYSIQEYIANGGYGAWVKALFEMSPDDVVEQIKASGVRGRGGAGFPAGIKLESGRKARVEPKFMACNSHEGEPNVYKDRRLIESDPHLVLEGIMLGCYGMGAKRGYNYVGGEHLLAVERFKHAVDQAYAYGLLGDNVLGTGVTCHIRIRIGGGAYICGEGSALMYSVMGDRGQPRTKPPRSVEEGLWRRPTVLNNTETVATFPWIVRNGGDWYAGLGTEKSTGTKLITMQGPLARLGVVEIEMGISLRDLIFDVYGGMAEGKTFKGIQTGGVSAACLTDEQLDVSVDFDSMTPLDGMLGSGGFVVFDQSVDAVEFARYLMEFNRWESCSKCTPCRIGNPALVEIVDRILNGGGASGDIDLIKRSSKHVMELSLCGLGQVAPAPLLGMIKAFPHEFEAYLEGQKHRNAPQNTYRVALAGD